MSKSSTTQNEQTKTEIDPRLRDEYLGNIQQAKSVGEFITAQGPYSGPRAGSAPMGGAGVQSGRLLNQLANGLQLDVPQGAPGASIAQSWDLLARAQNAPDESISRTRDTLAQATAQPSLEVGAYGYNPQQFQIPGATVSAAESGAERINPSAIRDVNPYFTPRQDVRDLGAGSIRSGMSPYENRYAEQVIDRGLLDLDRARTLAQQQNAAQAVRQGAYGGSRQAVLEGETNRGFADAASRFIGDQRSAGFNAAAGLSAQDIANAQRAGAANQAADLAMSSAYMDAANRARAGNQQVDLATATANQAAINAMQEANAQRSQQAAMASAGFGQQSGLANQQAALEAQRYNASARQQADVANQSANQDRIRQLLQAAQQYQSLAGMQHQLPLQTAQQYQSLADMQQRMPLQAAQALQQYDAYGRGVSNEQAQAQQAAFDDQRFYMLPAMQVQSGALGINLPNLGMSSTGSSKTTYQPSGLQTLGQIAQIGGMFF